ncbi:MAG TPA: CBS domain-containing protein [Candidatus Omnitrophota bacterium]|nr:CBS domain-containing protein [Candidatus Omnitrophota bacterium]
MTKEVISITPQTPIKEIIEILAVKKITGVPVVDENKKLLGIISELDLIGLLLQDSDIDNKKAEDFITKDVTSFSANDGIDKLCQYLLNKPFRRVPIVDNGCLVGIVSRADIIALIWKKYNERKNPSKS